LVQGAKAGGALDRVWVGEEAFWFTVLRWVGLWMGFWVSEEAFFLRVLRQVGL
jgi:hypothetical protein